MSRTKIERIKIDRQERVLRALGAIAALSLLPIFLILWGVLFFETGYLMGDYYDPDIYEVGSTISLQNDFFYKVFNSTSGKFSISYQFLRWVFIVISWLGAILWPVILVRWISATENIFTQLRQIRKWPMAQIILLWGTLLVAFYYYFYYYFAKEYNFSSPVKAVIILYFEGLGGIVRHLCNALHHACGMADPNFITFLLINAWGVLLERRLVKKWFMRVAGWFGRFLPPAN